MEIILDSIHKSDEEYARYLPGVERGSARYTYTTIGCGCCSDDGDMTIEKMDEYIDSLRLAIEDALLIKQDMIDNGEYFVCTPEQIEKAKKDAEKWAARKSSYVLAVGNATGFVGVSG